MLARIAVWELATHAGTLLVRAASTRVLVPMPARKDFALRRVQLRPKPNRSQCRFVSGERDQHVNDVLAVGYGVHVLNKFNVGSRECEASAAYARAFIRNF